MNCQIFACVNLFELKMILSYCDITNRSELLMTHWRDAPFDIRHDGRIIFLNVPLGGMHQSASAMMAYNIFKMTTWWDAPIGIRHDGESKLLNG